MTVFLGEEVEGNQVFAKLLGGRKDTPEKWPLFCGDFTHERVKESENLSVLFVCERPRDWRSEQEGGLLAKMMTALKLNPGESAVSFLEGERISNSLSRDIRRMKPRVIVSLGALATNVLLERRERISLVHGKTFNCVIEGLSVQLIPVFHPDILNINPNMKRTAWLDLQKVLKLIGR